MIADPVEERREKNPIPNANASTKPLSSPRPLQQPQERRERHPCKRRDVGLGERQREDDSGDGHHGQGRGAGQDASVRGLSGFRRSLDRAHASRLRAVTSS